MLTYVGSIGHGLKPGDVIRIDDDEVITFVERTQRWNGEKKETWFEFDLDGYPLMIQAQQFSVYFGCLRKDGGGIQKYL